MSESEVLRQRIVGLEAEVGEATAARAAAEGRVAEVEAALQAAYDALTRLGDPLFARTFADSRLQEVADLKRRLHRQRRRNRRLQAELERVRGRRAYQLAAGAGRLLRVGRLDR